MPPVVRSVRPRPRVALIPEGVAERVMPEIRRDLIPPRVTMGRHSVPFAGELREEESGQKFLRPLPAGALVTLATLRRPWNYVGVIINPGNAGTGCTWAFRVLASTVNGLTVPVAVPAGRVTAFIGFIVGAACELVFINGTEAPVKGFQGAIWGMSEK